MIRLMAFVLTLAIMMVMVMKSQSMLPFLIYMS
jgi:hypothetical protein